jgi:hypothetical protein
MLSLSVGSAWAQPAPQADRTQDSQGKRAPREEVTVPELPVSLDRIQRQLAQTSRSTDDPLRLRYYVEVYGTLPPLVLFEKADLESAAVPYGGPTHRDMLYQITPEEFRSPPADLTSLAALLARWLSGNKDQK